MDLDSSRLGFEDAVNITLTAEELRLAAMVEVARRVENLSQGRQPKYGAEHGWTTGVEGAAAEMALAKHLGVYWSGAIGNLKAADVGRLQVRSTARLDGCLILHPSDADDDVFILAVGVAPTFEFRGWLRAKDGKLPEFWRDPNTGRPAFFVPQDKLRTMRENKKAS